MTLYVQFTQVQYIDLSEIVQFMKAISIVTSVQQKKSTLIVVSHVLSAKVSPDGGKTQVLRPRKSAPIP